MDLLTPSKFSGNNWRQFLTSIRINPKVVFWVIIFSALIAFEIFNYSTTDYAFQDLLGDLKFAGIRWGTILSIAFCGIDFAGIARLFSPEDRQGSDPHGAWYLFGAWMLAATMNAVLTWWGVSMAIANHNVQSSAVIDSSTVMKVVPVFVAIMVWVIRILVIGSLSMATERMFADQRVTVSPRPVVSQALPRSTSVNPSMNTSYPVNNPAPRPAPSSPAPRQASAPAARPGGQQPAASAPAPRQAVNTPEPVARPEPTYHSIGMSSAAKPSQRSDSNSQRY